MSKLDEYSEILKNEYIEKFNNVFEEWKQNLNAHKQININDYVTIYPTDEGWQKIRSIMKKDYLASDYHVDKWISHCATEDGGFRDQLWVIIDKFNELFKLDSVYLDSMLMPVESNNESAK